MSRFLIRNYASAASLSGSSSYVRSGSGGANLGITGTAAFSMSCWIYVTAKSGYETFMFFGTAGTANGVYFGIRSGSPDSTLVAFTQVTSSTVLNIDTWYHLTLTFAGGAAGAVNIYVNGVNVITGAYTPSIVDGPLTMGADQAGNNNLIGNINEACVWSRVLSTTEITNLYLNGIVPTSGLVRYYKLTDGSGSAPIDSSVNNDTATGSNLTWSSNTPMMSRSNVTQSQNLILQNETPDNVSWNRSSNIAFTAGASTPPTGVGQMYQLSSTNGNVAHQAGQQITFGAITSNAGRTMTASAYVQQGTAPFVVIGTDIHSAYYFAAFQFSTQTFTNGANVSSGFQQINNTPTYRIWATWTTPINDGNPTLEGISCFPSPTALVSGNTYNNNGQTVFAGGFQLVNSNQAGAYIKTTASAVNTGTLRQIISQSQNLAAWSEDFTQSGTWLTNAITSVAANQIANPRNGLVNVSGLVANSSNTLHYINQTFTAVIGLSYTISVYAKAGNKNWLAIEPVAPSVAYFNLSTGTIGTVTAGTATIQSFTNGWYLCTLTFIPSATSMSGFFITATADGVTTFAGDTTTINTYLFGAMVTQSNAITIYTPTTASAIAGSAERVLITQNQNLLTYSQDLTQAASWTAANCSFTNNAITAPDGTLTGNALIASSTASNQKSILQNEPLYSTFTTASIYAKAGTVQWLYFYNEAGEEIAFFNLSGSGSLGTTSFATGTVGSATITNVGNGWYRCSVTKMRIYFGATQIVFIPANANGGNVYAASDTTSAQIYLWGARFVTGTTAGLYTTTTTAAINNGGIRNAV